MASENEHSYSRSLERYAARRFSGRRLHRLLDDRFELLWQGVNRLFRTGRPTYDSEVATTIYVDVSAGSDATGGGTAAAPFASIQQALSVIPRNRPGGETIVLQLADGTYSEDLSGLMADLDRITIQGTATDGTAYNISSIGATSEANGNVLTLDTPNEPVAQDALRGTRVKFDNDVIGWIYANAASTGGAGSETTVVYVSYGAEAFGSPSVSEDLTFQTLGAVIETDSEHLTFVGCETLILKDLSIDVQSSGRAIFVYRSSRVDLNGCYFGGRQVVAGAEGRLLVQTSYLELKGVSGGFRRWGGVRASNKSVLTLTNGTVVDFATQAQAAAGRHLVAQGDGTIDYTGEVVLVGLGTNGVLSEGGSILYIPGTVQQSGTPFFRFALAGDGTTTTCENGFRFNEGQGVRGAGELRAYGEVDSDYTVTGTRGAYVWLNSDTSVTDATGTNTGSADDGSTTSASNADGTLIVGP